MHMKIRRGFRGDVTPYLPSWSSAFLFAHVCLLHAKQMKQVKQTASKTRFKEPTRRGGSGVDGGRGRLVLCVAPGRGKALTCARQGRLFLRSFVSLLPPMFA